MGWEFGAYWTVTDGAALQCQETWTAAGSEFASFDDPLCVALLDLDNFKGFNDEHGHPAGDALLRETASEWGALLRASDLLARYGGEESRSPSPPGRSRPHCSSSSAYAPPTPGAVTCSAGLVPCSTDDRPEQVIARADAALYQAKRSGRDRRVTAA